LTAFFLAVIPKINIELSFLLLFFGILSTALTILL